MPYSDPLVSFSLLNTNMPHSDPPMMPLICFSQGLDSLLDLLRGQGAATTRTAPEADGPALDGKAATSATVGSGGWGVEEEDGECVADGGGAFSKVVAARRSTLHTKGQLDPLYLLEAVQVGGWDPDPASYKVNPLNLLGSSCVAVRIQISGTA